eukprot:1469107-Pyramimonas_sp.AAC.1
MKSEHVSGVQFWPGSLRPFPRPRLLGGICTWGRHPWGREGLRRFLARLRARKVSPRGLGGASSPVPGVFRDKAVAPLTPGSGGGRAVCSGPHVLPGRRAGLSS